MLAQYVRFSLVGLSNGCIDLFVLNLLLYLHPTDDPLTLLAFNTLAVGLAILNSYLWNTRWTFRALATGTRREHALFLAQALLNIGLNNLVLLAVSERLEPASGIWSLAANNAAKLCAMVVASTTSFLLLRSVVFRPRRALRHAPR